MYGYSRRRFEDHISSPYHSSTSNFVSHSPITDPWSIDVEYDCHCPSTNCRHREQYTISAALDNGRPRRLSLSYYSDDGTESVFSRPYSAYEGVRYHRTEKEYRREGSSKSYAGYHDDVFSSNSFPESEKGISINGNNIYAGGNVTYIENMKIRKGSRSAPRVHIETPLQMMAVEDRTGLWPKKCRYVYISPKQKMSQLFEELLGNSRSRRVVAHRGRGLGKVILSRHHTMESLFHEVKYLEIVYAEQTALIRRY